MKITERAVEMIPDGAAVGLGSGHTASAFVEALAVRVQAGLRVRGVPTSRPTEQLASHLGIPLVPLEDAMPLDIAVDGADEVDPQLNLIKGYGRALVREKIVAAAARKLVILAALEKKVAILGDRHKLPVEVVPFGMPLVEQRLTALGCQPVPYTVAGQLFVTDNGNHIFDCAINPLTDPATLEVAIRAIPGVVATGLFLGMADVVLFGDQDLNLVEVQERGGR